MDCLHPRNVKNPQTKKIMTVPCGYCMSCRLKKKREWVVRITQESDYWKDKVFITLTYEDEYLPMTNCHRPTLLKEELQGYFKRLRARVDKPFKYFACGEYGDTTHRPHYHAIVFGLSLEDYRDLNLAWKKGFVTADVVIPERIEYVCGYVQKKVRLDPREFLADYGCCQQPFQLISHGFGLRYYEDHKEYFHKHLGQTYRGSNLSIPRYYLKHDEELKKKCQVKGEITNIDNLRKQADLTGSEIIESMYQRERNLKARLKSRKSKL